MAHHRRRKPRRKVRCQICTPGRQGNSSKGEQAARAFVRNLSAGYAKVYGAARR